MLQSGLGSVLLEIMRILFFGAVCRAVGFLFRTFI
jgi:hypothetical protein